jgi:hypothetical protein
MAWFEMLKFEPSFAYPKWIDYGNQKRSVLEYTKKLLDFGASWNNIRTKLRKYNVEDEFDWVKEELSE